MQSWLLGSNVSQLTLVAAVVAVGDAAHIALEQRKNRAARAFTRSYFETKGYAVSETQANFMMVDIKRDAKQFKTDCLKRKVAVGRQFASLPNHTRVSVGTMPEMRKAVRVFDAVLGGTS
jgi:histidinol-phosphate aminotransferase